jgi:sulfur relay (sulfurtransferase) DsrC/TusE family protein
VDRPEIKEDDKKYLHSMKEWNAERKELLKKRHEEEAAEKERKEEVEKRHAASAGRRGSRSLSVFIMRKQ